MFHGADMLGEVGETDKCENGDTDCGGKSRARQEGWCESGAEGAGVDTRIGWSERPFREGDTGPEGERRGQAMQLELGQVGGGRRPSKEKKYWREGDEEGVDL